MWTDEFGQTAPRMEPSKRPEPATRSRIVLDTRVSPDDRVPLVVRYSMNGCCRPFPDIQDRPYDGAGGARKRSSAEGVGLRQNRTVVAIFVVATTPKVATASSA
jgi:hypothetical protein